LSTFVQVILNGLVSGALLAVVAIGLTLIFGILHVINFAHGVLFLMGAYIVWYFTTHGVPYYATLPIAMAAIGAVGVLLEVGVFNRLHGKVLEGAIAGIAVMVLLQNALTYILPGDAQALDSPLSGRLEAGGVVISHHRIFVVLVASALCYGVYAFIRYTRLGRAIRAMQQDRIAAELQGIRVRTLGPLAFGIGAALAGIAGGLVAPLQPISLTMGDAPLLSAFVVVILGGMGSVGGTFAAALLIGITQSVVTTYWSAPGAVAVSFLLAMVVLVIRPEGLARHA
jgi:branched-chain amino acid transport system permease protein